MVLKMVIKMADINGPAKSWKLHEFWTERITEEFFRQVLQVHGSCEVLIIKSLEAYFIYFNLSKSGFK